MNDRRAFVSATLRLLALALAVSLAAWGAPAHAGGRTLHIDDVLSIRVVSQPDLDTTVRVETDGTINFPYTGRLRAAGRSQDEVAAAIAAKLKAADVVKDPRVLVEISNFGSQATVHGAVGTPGVVLLDRPLTLSQVLSKSGGLKEGSGDIVVRRRGKNGTTVYTYPSRDLVTGKLDGEKIFVYNNDEIFVDTAPLYYLWGFVARPGQFVLSRPMTVQQAIAIGGGLAQLGSESRINIKRAQPDGSWKEFPASLDDVVQPNDTIVVNERWF